MLQLKRIWKTCPTSVVSWMLPLIYVTVQVLEWFHVAKRKAMYKQQFIAVLLYATVYIVLTRVASAVVHVRRLLLSVTCGALHFPCRWFSIAPFFYARHTVTTATRGNCTYCTDSEMLPTMVRKLMTMRFKTTNKWIHFCFCSNDSAVSRFPTSFIFHPPLVLLRAFFVGYSRWCRPLRAGHINVSGLRVCLLPFLRWRNLNTPVN